MTISSINYYNKFRKLKLYNKNNTCNRILKLNIVVDIYEAQ